MRSVYLHTILAFLICISSWPFVGVASGYSGGLGTVENPYQIDSKADILQFATTVGDYNEHFILTADIDLAGDVYEAALISSDKTGAANFNGSAFTGSLNGDYHCISNLTIDPNGSAYSYLGLFGRLGEGSRIRNLKLSNITINQATWSKCIGALAGDITKNCELYRCEVIDANINAPSKAGLLVGECAGVITNCHVRGTLTGHSACGGLVGNLAGDDTSDERDDGIIEKCTAAGQVRAATQGGGIAGASQLISKISECFSSTQVNGGTGAQKIGGLVGENIGGYITNCYVTGNVAVDANSTKIGGFIGQSGPDFFYPGFIMMTYCRNSVTYGTGCSDYGGYAGSNVGSTLLSNYYLLPSDLNLINGIGTVLTETQMQTQSSFENWDFEDIWTMEVYPVLAWMNLVELTEFAELARFWMHTECSDAQPCAAVDWYIDGIIDAKDLGQLAGCWLSYGIDVVNPTH